ncbi:restriction endonuclease subunit S [Vibrio vulnificus]
MSELPKGWVETDFGNVIDSITNGISDKQNKESNGIPVSRIETIADQTINYSKIGFVDNYDDEKAKKYLLNEGDILFSHINSPIHLGKTAIFDGRKELFHGTNLLRIVVNKRVTLSSYFNYYCKFTRAIGAFSLNAQHAVNQSSLNQKKIKAFSIPLAPLAEQTRIVEKLDEVLAQVDTIKARLDGIPALLKRFRQSVLASAVSGKLTEDWRGEYGALGQDLGLIERIKVSLINDKTVKKDLNFEISNKIFDIPDAWSFLKLKSLASKITDGEHKTPKREESGRYLLSARNVRDGYLSLDNVDYVGEEEYQKLRKRCDPNKGDILISCSGSVGRISLVDADDKYVMVRSAALVKVIADFLLNSYLVYVLQSPELQKRIEESSKSTAQSNLFLGPIKELEIPLPSIEEQKEIVRLVDQYFAFADTIEVQVKKAQARVDNLTQSILAKAFRGELVPQDPNDEPADKLLERIVQARKEAEALAKTAKKAQSTKSTAKKKVAKSA